MSQGELKLDGVQAITVIGMASIGRRATWLTFVLVGY